MWIFPAAPAATPLAALPRVDQPRSARLKPYLRAGTQLARSAVMRCRDRVRASVLSAMLIAGCASHEPVYVRPNTTETTRRSDEAACVKVSIGAKQPAQPATTAAVDRDAVAQSMQAKGYTLLRP